ERQEKNVAPLCAILTQIIVLNEAVGVFRAAEIAVGKRRQAFLTRRDPREVVRDDDELTQFRFDPRFVPIDLGEKDVALLITEQFLSERLPGLVLSDLTVSYRWN